jgi:hypothetical protein
VVYTVCYSGYIEQEVPPPNVVKHLRDKVVSNLFGGCYYSNLPSKETLLTEINQSSRRVPQRCAAISEKT